MRSSGRELEGFETPEGRVDPRSVPGPFVDRCPLLDQQAPRGPVRLEIDHRGDPVVDEDGQGKIAALTLGRGQIGLEQVEIAEKRLQPPALDDQRIERRKDVDDRLLCGCIASARTSGVAQWSGSSGIATGTRRPRRTSVSISAAIAFLRAASM